MVDRNFKACGCDAGLPPGFSPQALRATFITTAPQAGASLEALQRSVGGANTTATKREVRKGQDEKQSVRFEAPHGCAHLETEMARQRAAAANEEPTYRQVELGLELKRPERPRETAHERPRGDS